MTPSAFQALHIKISVLYKAKLYWVSTAKPSVSLSSHIEVTLLIMETDTRNKNVQNFINFFLHSDIPEKCIIIRTVIKIISTCSSQS